ncbi:unnamed protein product [Discula destructiva]
MSTYSPAGTPGFWSESAPSRSARTSGSKDADPPRPARDGWEWVWFPEGYWAERPVPRRRSSTEVVQKQERAPSVARPSKIFKWQSRPSKSPKELFERRPSERPNVSRSTTEVSPFSEAQHLLWQLPKDLPQSPYLSEQEQVAALQQSAPPILGSRTPGPYVRDTWKSIDAEATVPLAEVLAPSVRHNAASSGSRLSWRPFRKNKSPESTKEIPEEPRVEAVPADTTPSYFTLKPILRPSDHTPPHTPPVGEGSRTRPGSKRVSFSALRHDPSPVPLKQAATVSVRGPRSLRKWLSLKIPRGRNRPLTPSTGSATSSREKWEADSTPSSPASSFIAFNRPVHLPDATPSYPAGEAKLVETPPLKKDTADGKPRSLFMDIKHADIKHADQNENSSNSSTDDDKSIRVEPRVFSYRKGQTPERRQWWDEPKAAVRRDPVRDVSFFEFNMPEHLPNSPMCPANPMHKGKGKLVCVYHGRATASEE